MQRVITDSICKFDRVTFLTQIHPAVRRTCQQGAVNADGSLLHNAQRARIGRFPAP
jgi:hypothetical protein